MLSKGSARFHTTAGHRRLVSLSDWRAIVELLAWKAKRIGKIGKKSLDFGKSHLSRVPLIVEKDVAPYPLRLDKKWVIVISACFQLKRLW
ncbi:MAG: hypothetical protein J7L73_03485 [Anaerolineales bacterium]|nr:hypothetical protein [Anaerolineales bacterium]